MMSSWLSGLPRTQPDLLRVIYDFNHRPGFWIHAEHFSQVSEQERRSVLECGLSYHPRVNAWLKQKFGLVDLGETWDFEALPARLALLTIEDLRCLVYHFGAVHGSPKIVAMIGKRQIQEFKAEFGESTYQFVVRKGRHWQVDSSLIASIQSQQKGLSDEILTLGWGSMRKILEPFGPKLTKRVELKLSIGEREFFCANSELRFEKDPWALYHKLIPEILAPSQQSCFA